jgi:hypothetical protein
MIEEYDFSICSQTGYHDAGERFCCGACGATGNADELCTHGSFLAETAARCTMARFRQRHAEKEVVTLP